MRNLIGTQGTVLHSNSMSSGLAKGTKVKVLSYDDSDESYKVLVLDCGITKWIEVKHYVPSGNVVHKEEFVIGEHYIVIRRVSGHGFSIGENVVHIGGSSFKNANGTTWALSKGVVSVKQFNSYKHIAVVIDEQFGHGFENGSIVGSDDFEHWTMINGVHKSSPSVKKWGIDPTVELSVFKKREAQLFYEGDSIEVLHNYAFSTPFVVGEELTIDKAIKQEGGEFLYKVRDVKSVHSATYNLYGYHAKHYEVKTFTYTKCEEEPVEVKTKEIEYTKFTLEGDHEICGIDFYTKSSREELRSNFAKAISKGITLHTSGNKDLDLDYSIPADVLKTVALSVLY